MATATAPSGQQWVRSYLQGLGYNDNQIGYNPASKSVTLGGADFFQPTYTSDGKAYGTTDQLDNAYNTYQYRQGQKSANDLVSRFRAALDKPATPVTPFSYDPESDPEYQAALRTAQSNAKQATGNAIASLNARGIDTSSVASDRAAQIEQQSLGQVTDQVLPQLASQAYTRWLNNENMNYGREQDQLGNLLQLLGITNQQNQQYLDNQANQKNANLSAALNVGNTFGRAVTPQSDWSGLFRQATNPSTPLNLAGQQQQFSQDQTTKEFNENARQFGLQYALQKQAQANSMANANADNARQNQSASFQRLTDIWQLTGVAPSGLEAYGVKAGTPLPATGTSSAKPAQYDFRTDPGFASDIAHINTLAPDAAISEIQNNAQAFIAAYGYDGYQALLKAADQSTGG